MASVALINPWNFHEEGIAYRSEQLMHIWRNPPMGLVLLATELCEVGHDVTICDLERDLVVNGGDLQATLAGLRKSLEKIQPDFVGVTILSVRYLEAQRIVELCDKLRCNMAHNPKIVVGNIHSTVEPEATLRDNPAVDVAFVGEADKPFLHLVNGEPIEEISGVAFRQDKSIVVKPPWYAPNLDELPFPNWNFIDVEFYTAPSYAAHARTKRPAHSLDIIISRGCPYRCTFCAYNKMRYRWNSPEYVVKNIEYMLDNFNIDSMYFLDSSIGNNRKQLEAICKILIEKGLNNRFHWSANMRCNQVDEELLRQMWRAGCRKLFYGFESGSQRVLDAMKKGCTVEQNEKVAHLHRKLEFPYHASMIMGFVGETVEDLEMTLRWLERARPPIVGVNTYVPLPGSEDYYELKKTGKVKVEDPRIWRMIGEVNNPNAPIFCNIPSALFWKYFDEMKALAEKLRREAQNSRMWKEM